MKVCLKGIATARDTSTREFIQERIDTYSFDQMISVRPLAITLKFEIWNHLRIPVTKVLKDERDIPHERRIPGEKEDDPNETGPPSPKESYFASECQGIIVV